MATTRAAHDHELLPRLADALDFAIESYAIVARDLRLRHVSAGFSDLLADATVGLCARDGLLSCVDQASAARLQAWLADLLSGKPASGPFLAIERLDQLPVLLRGKLLRAPEEEVPHEEVPQGEAPHAGARDGASRNGERPDSKGFAGAAGDGKASNGEIRGGERLAIIAAYDPSASRTLDKVSDIFELTAAERTIAEQVLGGASIRDIQAASGVTENTVRTHLKSIYRKTSAHNQADLIRLLKDVSAIAPRAPSAEPGQDPQAHAQPAGAPAGPRSTAT